MADAGALVAKLRLGPDEAEIIAGDGIDVDAEIVVDGDRPIGRPGAALIIIVRDGNVENSSLDPDVRRSYAPRRV